MKKYNELKKEILRGLNEGYYVTVEFKSKTCSQKITMHRKSPLNFIFDRIKFIIRFYDNIMHEKVGKIIVHYDYISLETFIFVEVNSG